MCKKCFFIRSVIQLTRVAWVENWKKLKTNKIEACDPAMEYSDIDSQTSGTGWLMKWRVYSMLNLITEQLGI